MSDHTQDAWYLTPEESLHGLATAQRNYSVGFLKKNALPANKHLVIPPSAIRKLIDNHVPVRVERELGKGLGFIDMDYADMGADLDDNAETIIQHSNIVVQLAPFSTAELQQLKENQIIITSIKADEMAVDELCILQEKKITALSLSLVKNVEGGSLMADILRHESPLFASGALGELVCSLILPILLNPNLRYAVQTAPALFNAIYFYKGNLTHAQIAEKMQLPYTDLLMLCWDWN